MKVYGIMDQLYDVIKPHYFSFSREAAVAYAKKEHDEWFYNRKYPYGLEYKQSLRRYLEGIFEIEIDKIYADNDSSYYFSVQDSDLSE